MFDDDDNDLTVDLSTSRMKSVGAKWIVQLHEYLADKPHIIVNGFKHVGIYSALGLLDDDDDIPDYLTTDDSDTDDVEDEIEELMEPIGNTTSNHLSVATVYSDTEEETEMNEIDQEVIIISSSEDDL